MGFRYVVLGSGRQGVALAYDLAKNGEAERVVLADNDGAVAERAAERVRKLLPDTRASLEARAWT
jgi:lysine 6-dehydrogenase